MLNSRLLTFPRRRAAGALTGTALASAGLAAGLLFLAPATAEAHVRVIADSTAAGSFSALTFRVPNESDQARTVKLQVRLPTDTPFLFVSVKPVPGWTAVTKKETLPKPVEMEGTTITKAVTTVSWTATSGGVKPGEYQEFSISAGPLPNPGQLILPATQTYSDGTVVTWDEPTPASGAEPEHPAPEFDVTAATADGHGAGHTESAAPDTSPSTPANADGQAPNSVSTSDPLARGLGVAALAVGAAGLAVGLISRRRNAK